MGELSEFSKGIAHGLIWSAIGVALTFTALLIAVEQRDDARELLEQANVRLDEARRDCRRQPTRLSCSPVSPSSGLFMCQLPGDRFTWLTWKAQQL